MPPRLVGGRVPQERINYMVEKLIRVRNLTNQAMTILQPYFQIPSHIRDADEHLTNQQKALIDRNDALITNLMEKVHRRYKDICKESGAGFKQSRLAHAIQRAEKLYFEIYKEQWGGYALYDEIAVEKKLTDFQAYLNSLNLHL